MKTKHRKREQVTKTFVVVTQNKMLRELPAKTLLYVNMLSRCPESSHLVQGRVPLLRLGRQTDSQTELSLSQPSPPCSHLDSDKNS